MPPAGAGDEIVAPDQPEPAWQADAMVALVEDLRFRGLVHQMTAPELADRLDRESLTAYSGFDPTADSLHVGHLLQLCNLRRLQLAGHRTIAVAGGATGLIGDPGGKSEERTLLSPEELRTNTEGIHAQLARFLELDGTTRSTDAVLVDNAEWLATLPMLEFLRDVGKHFTVGQMTAKDSVRTRLDRPEQGISYTEFSYMLLQAYDFLHLFDTFGCRLQLGGSDQWGNITMGIDLIRRLRRHEAWGLTTPLVVKADGTKFGKTETGTVWLDPARTSPYQLYQFFLRTEDDVVGAHLRYFTFLPHERIAELDRATAEQPELREAPRELARQVCTLVHGAGETERAEEVAAALFGEGVAGLDERSLLDAFAEAPSTSLARGRLDDGGVPLVDLLTETGILPSKTRARSTVEQGGVYVNNRRERDADRAIRSDDLIAGRYVVLRRGKRDYHLVSFA
jgi:tyrosyl-tRNA synthetase